MTLPQIAPETLWVRSKDGIIAGVCEGIARRLQVEAWMIRFFLVMSIFFLGTGLLAYAVLAICFPREDRIPAAYTKMILGVCLRISRRFNVEIGVVRAAFAFITISTAGSALIAYIALFFLMPDQPSAELKQSESTTLDKSI